MGPCRRKLPLYGIRHPEGRCHLSESFPRSAATQTAESLEPHQPGYPMATHSEPLGSQILMNTWTPIPPARRLIAGPNLREQPLILLRADSDRTPTPRIEPPAGDLEYPTEHLHGIGRLLCLDEARPQTDSLAKKARLFLNRGSGQAYLLALSTCLIDTAWSTNPFL
jgi:hypothetical protein